MNVTHSLPARTLRIVLAMVCHPCRRPRPGGPVAVPREGCGHSHGLLVILDPARPRPAP